MPRTNGISAAWDVIEARESPVVTHSGTIIDPVKPDQSKILALDIAEHSAKLAMYLGASAVLYTRAHHMTLLGMDVGKDAGPGAGLYALLHDAAFTYTANPILIPGLRRAIFAAFGLEAQVPVSIRVVIERHHNNLELSELLQFERGTKERIAELQAMGAQPIKRAIKVRSWDHAHQEYLSALRTFARAAAPERLPSLRGLL
jgi:hypothetical protein